MATDEKLRRELLDLRAMGEAIAERATQLEKKLFPVSEGAARKGRRPNAIVQAALDRRNRFIAKHAQK